MVTYKHSNFLVFKSFGYLLLVCGTDILQVNILIQSSDNFRNLLMMVNSGQNYGHSLQISRERLWLSGCYLGLSVCVSRDGYSQFYACDWSINYNLSTGFTFETLFQMNNVICT